MQFIRQIFVKGLIAVIPVALTLYLVVWLARSFEILIGNLIRLVVPDSFYLPGMGLFGGVLLVLAVGLMLQTWFARRLWSFGEQMLDKMPLVRAVFGASKQIVTYLSTSDGPAEGRAVLVNLDGNSLRVLGMVTRESLEFLKHTEDDNDPQVAVFLPWSYQVGGFTVFLPASRIERIEMSANEALRIALTAAVGKSSS